MVEKKSFSDSFQSKRFKVALKKNSLVIIGSVSRLNSSDWSATKSYLKSLGLRCLKVTNRVLRRDLEKSIFLHHTRTISGSTIIVTCKSQIDIKKLRNLQQHKPDVALLCVKINNRFYPINYLEKTVDYRVAVANFQGVFYKRLKRTAVAGVYLSNKYSSK